MTLHSTRCRPSLAYGLVTCRLVSHLKFTDRWTSISRSLILHSKSGIFVTLQHTSASLDFNSMTCSLSCSANSFSPSNLASCSILSFSKAACLSISIWASYCLCSSLDDASLSSCSSTCSPQPLITCLLWCSLSIC